MLIFRLTGVSSGWRITCKGRLYSVILCLYSGWLEPLLGRIAEDTRHVVTPVIDTISDKTMAFLSTGTHSVFVGGFDWALTFTWHILPAADRKLRKTQADPAK